MANNTIIAAIIMMRMKWQKGTHQQMFVPAQKMKIN
jgi:hypothetical protein